MSAARWHVITGATGAGKSTYAREFAQRVGGVHFSIDEWMNALFWMDCPEKNDLPWALERIARCEAQIAMLATQVAEAGVIVVLDLGFTQRQQRFAWLERARVAGIPCALDVLELDASTRWDRVRERNEGVSATYSFAVSREMFEFMEERWELPDEAERALFKNVVADPSGL